MAEVVGQSLARRLLIFAALWIAVLLSVSFFVLSAVNRNAVERAFDRRLQVYVKLLIDDIAAQIDDPAASTGGNLGEPLFNLPQSGWYWQIERRGGSIKDRRQSRSLIGMPRLALNDDVPRDPLTGAREGYRDGPRGEGLRVIERPVDLGDDGAFDVTVAGKAEDITEAVHQFNLWLLGVLGILGGSMLIAAVVQVRFGLRPLQRLRSALRAIRHEGAPRLDGRFPQEVAPLVNEINGLLAANQEIVERARTHVGNLAHALKTPLTVLLNEAHRSDSPLADKITEQATLMREQVEHHLRRARLAARLQTMTESIEVAPVVEAIARTLGKISERRGIAVTAECGDGLRFRGEKQDLEEIVGNLVDNACKWAQASVHLTLEPVPADPAQRPFFRIVVDDDGPGLSAAQREAVGQRGLRLDETKPGSGLGLAIVRDLVGLYGGTLTLDSAPLGGLRAVITLPRQE